jgi:hypothetical protein
MSINRLIIVLAVILNLLLFNSSELNATSRGEDRRDNSTQTTSNPNH